MDIANPIIVSTAGLLSEEPLAIATNGFLYPDEVVTGVVVTPLFGCDAIRPPNKPASPFLADPVEPECEHWCPDPPLISGVGERFALDIATQGVLSAGELFLATNGLLGIIQEPGEVQCPPTPSLDFWVRENPSSPLVGPYSFPQADAAARALSDDETKSGFAELVSIVGLRAGDPSTLTKTRIMYLYIRGRRTLGGRAAEYNSICLNTPVDGLIDGQILLNGVPIVLTDTPIILVP